MHCHLGHEAEGEDLFDDFAHAQMRCWFKALCGADDNGIGRNMRKRASVDLAGMRGGHSPDHDLGVT